MADLSNIRVQITYVWKVNEDGSRGDLESQTEPSYFDAASGRGSYDLAQLLAALGQTATAEDENRRLREVLAQHGIEVPDSVTIQASDVSGTSEIVN